MSATFPVNWRRIFKSIAISMSAVIIGGILISVAIASMSGRAPKHAPPFTSFVAYVLVFAPAFSAVFALLISQWFRLASITVGDGIIEGRTFWGRKNRIPLSDVTNLTEFSSNGIRALVVQSKYHGKIYISDQTERLGELLGLLQPYLNEQRA